MSFEELLNVTAAAYFKRPIKKENVCTHSLWSNLLV